jgi:glycosyltransferase involved in cell wall biosynthesis
MRLDIIVPAHNEEHRIDRMLTEYRSGIENPAARFVIALDHCTDGTIEVVRRHAEVDPRVEWADYPKLGKGGVILETLRRCDADLMAFVDADCATPPAELLRLVAAAEGRTSVPADPEGAGCDIAIATRWHPAAVLPAHRPLPRRLASTLFAAGVRRLFGLPYRDTQCGAKVLRRHVAKAVVPLLSSRDFLFDVELLLTADALGYRVAEVPTVWVDQAGSRLHAARDGRRMALSALQLWLRTRIHPIPDRYLEGTPHLESANRAA